jgi:hypothetical protein
MAPKKLEKKPWKGDDVRGALGRSEPIVGIFIVSYGKYSLDVRPTWVTTSFRERTEFVSQWSTVIPYPLHATDVTGPSCQFIADEGLRALDISTWGTHHNPATQWRTERDLGCSTPPNSVALPNLTRIPSYVECTPIKPNQNMGLIHL